MRGAGNRTQHHAAANSEGAALAGKWLWRKHGIYPCFLSELGDLSMAVDHATAEEAVLPHRTVRRGAEEPSILGGARPETGTDAGQGAKTRRAQS